MIFVFFSNVRDSILYRSIIDNLATFGTSITYIFFGEESKVLENYCTQQGYNTLNLGAVSKVTAFYKILQIRRIIPKKSLSVLLSFGQTATLISFLGSFGNRNHTRIYSRMHTSMHQVEGMRKGIIYDSICNFLAHKIVVPNQNTFDYLINFERVESAKLETIYFGIPMRRFTANKSLFAFRIGIVSRLSKVKGLEYIFTALNDFLPSNPEYSVTWVGGGVQAPEFAKNFVKDQALHSRLRVLPFVSNMEDFYSEIDILIHCPIDPQVESFGLVYIEGMSHGLACIFTKSGIANEICESGINCVLVDYQSSESIYRALILLRDDQELLQRIRKAAHKSSKQFSLTKAATLYRKLLTESLQITE